MSSFMSSASDSWNDEKGIEVTFDEKSQRKSSLGRPSRRRPSHQRALSISVPNEEGARISRRNSQRRPSVQIRSFADGPGSSALNLEDETSTTGLLILVYLNHLAQGLEF